MFKLLGLLILGMPLFAAASEWQPPTDCRENIRKITCRVAVQTPEQEKSVLDRRPCLQGTEPYIEKILLAYDELPPKLQKMFCHLRRINLEEEYDGTAYAGQFFEETLTSKGRVAFRSGNVLGLNIQRAFDEDVNNWINRKEQMLFGRKHEDPLLPNFPKYEVVTGGFKAPYGLVSHILHEFGHMLSFANGVFGYDGRHCRRDNAQSCAFYRDGLWHSISWDRKDTIRDEDQIFGKDRLCFYRCELSDALSVERAGEFYREFFAAWNFMSPYAAVNSVEDFAETFEQMVSFEILTAEDDPAGRWINLELVIPGKDEERISLGRDNLDGHVAAKLEYMRSFYARDWLYDEESDALREFSFPIDEDGIPIEPAN